MDSTDLAICDIALPPAGTAPEWVQLLPAGRRIEGRDGRSWEMQDPTGLVLAFQHHGADLPIDFEHQNDKPEAKLKGPVPAAGWIKELKADAGGIWGRVEWTATARELIGRREYRYLSPSFIFNAKTSQITRLKGAGLVHNPNLHLVALASEQLGHREALSTELDAGLLTRLAQLLDLPPEATEAQVFAAIRGNADRLRKVLKQLADPDPAKFVPVAAVQEMLSERNLVIATASESRAKDKVADAMRRGYLSPAMKGWATALCMQNEASFDTFMASSVPAFAHLFAPPMTHMRAPPGAEARHEGSPEAEAICAQLGLPPGTLKD